MPITLPWSSTGRRLIRSCTRIWLASSKSVSAATLMTPRVMISPTVFPSLAMTSYSVTTPTNTLSSLTTGKPLMRYWDNRRAACWVVWFSLTVITWVVMTSRTFNLGELSRDTCYPPFHCLTTDHAQSCLIISRLKAEKWTYQKTKKTLHPANRPQEGPTSGASGGWAFLGSI